MLQCRPAPVIGLGRAGSGLEGLDAVGGAEQQQVGRAGGEQAVGDHADDGVDLLFQFHRAVDAQVVHVEDDIAVVGQHAFAVDRIAAELHQLAGDVAASHRDDLHRQRELAEDGYQLAGIGDADEGLGHRGDDLLAGQRGTAALDQLQALVAFVGAVDVELQLADRVQLVDRDAMFLQALGGGLRTGHCAVELGLVAGQGIDEEVGGGACADADDALAVEVRKNVVDGGLCHCLLELILVHPGCLSGCLAGRPGGAGGGCARPGRPGGFPARPVPLRYEGTNYSGLACSGLAPDDRQSRCFPAARR